MSVALKIPLIKSGAVNPLASASWVAQWKFNNNANDSIGANNLTASTSSPTFTTGKLGGATGATQLVAASSQYWSIASNANLQMGDVDFTIACWVKFGATGAQTILSKWNGGANPREYTLESDASNVLSFYLRNAAGAATVGATSTFGGLATGTWYCVICGYDSVTDKIFICVNDGALNQATLAGGCAVSTANFCIGAYQNPTQFIDGMIDNVCIAKSAAGGGGVLTAAQRTAFYNAGVGTETLT